MEVTLFAEPIFHIGPLVITNSMLMTIITTVLLSSIAIATSRNISFVPTSKLQLFAELVIESIYDMVEGLSDNKRAKIFFGVVASFFIFIITADYLGLFPGVGTIGFTQMHDGHEVFVPLLRSINSDLNVTLALALISVGLTHYYAVSGLGFGTYIKKYFSFNPIFLFVGLLEIIAEITKVFSLSFRLFGNVYAGETLLPTISSLFAFIVPLPFLFLGLLVGFVQVAIFMMLTLVFMAILTEKNLSH